MNAVFIHSKRIEQLHYPPDCPFKTERASMAKAILVSLGIYEGPGRSEVPMKPATEEELLLFHSPVYLQALRRIARYGMNAEDFFLGLGTDDCPVFPDMYDYAVLACGATLTGAKLILYKLADVVFNPSGGFHHALPATAGGFCYLNDMAVGCKFLADHGRRVFCLDLDAHHGNGTQDAFYRDPRVFTVSFHESGRTLYPGGGFENEIGEDAGKGFNVNVPLPAGTDDDLFLQAFGEVVPPLLGAFSPDVIVLELGMDVLSVDPLAHLKMTNNAVAGVLPPIMGFGRPILVTGGGGYHPEGTARGWALAWSVLCGVEPEALPALGMGGVFLGSTEWDAGLRDMHVYARGDEREHLDRQVRQTVDTIKRTVFPLHGIR